jgi:hypothetical protein
MNVLTNRLRICVAVTTAFCACSSGEPAETVSAGALEAATSAGTETAPEQAAADEAAAPGEEIDPDALSETGRVEIKQYSVAYIGSGTVGKGTLTYGGQEHAFRIGGLGIGGIGVASIDASGVVYDLPDLESFAGTYGNARLGATAADKGKGRLWLKNTNGVVLELRTEMKGLALTGGVDGIVITWESDVQEVKQDTQRALDNAGQKTEKAWGSVKRAFD